MTGYIFLSFCVHVERKRYVTVSAKVPQELKELMDKYGVKSGPVIRSWRAVGEHGLHEVSFSVSLCNEVSLPRLNPGLETRGAL